MIFWGTLWSVFSPLLLTAAPSQLVKECGGKLSRAGGRGPSFGMQVGEVGFLALAAAAFLVSTACVLPLQAASLERKIDVI